MGHIAYLSIVTPHVKIKNPLWPQSGLGGHDMKKAEYIWYENAYYMEIFSQL